VNNLLGFTVAALYSHFDVACSGTGLFQCHDLRFLLPRRTLHGAKCDYVRSVRFSAHIVTKVYF
jgi:hypothetical protein